MACFFKVFIWVLLSLSFVAYGAETVLPPDVSYKIISDEHKRNIKRTVEVSINKRVDETTLTLIAKDIKALDNTPVERTFIGYRLDGQNGMYWATTNYDPDLVIRFIGSSKDDYEKIIALHTPVPGEIIGTWYCSWAYDFKLVVYKAKDKVFIKSFYIDGPSKPELYTTKKTNGKIILMPAKPNTFGDHYEINTNGDLEFWNTKGNFYTASKTN